MAKRLKVKKSFKKEVTSYKLKKLKVKKESKIKVKAFFKSTVVLGRFWPFSHSENMINGSVYVFFNADGKGLRSDFKFQRGWRWKIEQ